MADFDPLKGASSYGSANPSIHTQQFINSGWWAIFNAGWLANQKEEGAEEIIENKKKTAHFIETFDGNIDDLQEGTYEWDEEKEEWICTSCKD